MLRPKKSQSEMVGFVLIVVLVVIAVMVFLVISIRNDSGDATDSLEVENLMGAVLDYTTDCAIVWVPNYDTIEDLIVSCSENDYCDSLNQSACDYLNETLRDVMVDLIGTEATVSAYQVEILEKDEDLEGELIPKIVSGVCEGQALRGQKIIPRTVKDDVVFRVSLCKD